MKLTDSIIHVLDKPVLVLDESLRTVFANPSLNETLGIAPGAELGRYVMDLFVSDEDLSSLKAVLESIVARERDDATLEVFCTKRSKHKIALSIKARRVDGDLEGASKVVVVEVQDITPVKELDRRVRELNEDLQRRSTDLEHINEALESFAQSVSHDLRSPLRLTNKIASLILQEHREGLPPGAVEKVNMILESTREMGELIEMLLHFSELSREPLKTRRVDMRRLARQTYEGMRSQLTDRHINCEIGAMPPCLADRALLKQVYTNLIANALKYTEECEQAEIRVGAIAVDGETQYFVQDNGIGFDMAHTKTIFLPFQRLHEARDVEGSGVGLAIVKRIAERHGGRVWANAEPNRGATFYFTVANKLSPRTGDSQGVPS